MIQGRYGDFGEVQRTLHRNTYLSTLRFWGVFCLTANIRTPQRTVSAMQRFAVSQKEPHRGDNYFTLFAILAFQRKKTGDSQPLDVKTGGTQPTLSAACFVVQSCLADADFVVFSDYCLIGTRRMHSLFMDCYTLMYSYLPHLMTENVRFPNKNVSISCHCEAAARPWQSLSQRHGIPERSTGARSKKEYLSQKTWESLRRFASYFFISRFCFIPCNHSSLRDDKPFRQRLPRRAHAPSSQWQNR